MVDEMGCIVSVNEAIIAIQEILKASQYQSIMAQKLNDIVIKFNI